MQKVVKI